MKTHPSPPSLRRAAMPMLALLVLVLLATACTDTDQLTPVRQALSFGATLPAMAPATDADTRAAHATRADATTLLTHTKSTFATGDRIAVSIDGVVKPYTYDASTARFTSADPHYSPSPAVQPRPMVEAWYPYSPIRPSDAPAQVPDQRLEADFFSADPLLAAPTALPRAGTMPTLTFGHLNALLKLNIKVDTRTLPGLTAAQLSGVEITTAPAATPIIAHRGPDGIIAPGCVAAYEALITPQTVSAPGITLTLTTTAPAKKYTATIPPAGPYLAGNVYVYNVTLLKDGIEVSIDKDEVEWGQGGIAELKDYDLTICNAEELKAFAELANSGRMIPGTNVQANYARVLQTADIDLAGIGNWTPIGNLSNYFRGAYNGNGYTISNLTIDGGARFNGLFGYVRGKDAASPAVLTGIHLRKVKSIVNRAESSCYSSTIAGYTREAVISFCSAQGEISATATGSQNYAGGITGTNEDNSVINHCRADVKVEARLSSSSGTCYAGGIAGQNWGAILACEASGSSVYAEGEDAYAGGITGYNRPIGNIYFCAAQKGEISVAGKRYIYAGGLTGRQGGQLHASYARGEAKAGAGAESSYAGAIVGGISSYPRQTYCIGLGAGEQGTSNLDANHSFADNIVYNAQATDGDIYNVVSQYPGSITISTTTYDASRFPAYGIELTEQTFSANEGTSGATSVWVNDAVSKEIRIRNLPPPIPKP